MFKQSSSRGLCAAMLVASVLLGTVTTGCGIGRAASAEDMKRFGTKVYPGHTREEVVQSAVTALKVLGYEVVTAEPRIRTSPKPISTSAAGGHYSATTYTSAVAWDIDVQSDARGASVLAECRGTLNGQPVDQFSYEWAETNFKQLFKEIDANMPVKK